MPCKPTERELLGALGTLIEAYAAIDEMLDAWIAASPDGATPEERRAQRASNRTRDKIARLYKRAIGRLPISTE